MLLFLGDDVLRIITTLCWPDVLRALWKSAKQTRRTLFRL